MTTRDTAWAPGTPCWVDLAADDVGRAVTFYSALFGWEVDEGREEFGGYATARKDGRAVAGLLPKMGPDVPSVWTTYLASADAGTTMRQVLEHGGQEMAPAMAVGDLGTMAIAVDAGGAVFGVWQAGTHTGFGLANEPGSVAWNEVFSRTWEVSKRFYADVFGWTYDDISSGDFVYATAMVDGAAVAGVGVLGEDMASMPPSWLVYFKVTDTDAAVAEVQRLGGTQLRAPWDTPFGRMAVVADDQGTSFMVVTDPPGPMTT